MTVTDNAYGGGEVRRTMAAGSKDTVVIDCSKSFGWYDVTVRITGNDVFERRFAGHVETGKESFSDPLMGQMV